jgi:hypothetical protein
MVEMATRYVINLSEDERLGLEDLLSRKRVSKLKAHRAQILLKGAKDKAAEVARHALCDMRVTRFSCGRDGPVYFAGWGSSRTKCCTSG